MSKPTGLILPPKIQGLGFVETVRGGDPNIGNGALTANKVYLCLTMPTDDVLLSWFAYYCHSAAGNVDLGAYELRGSTLYRLTSTGSTAASGTAARQKIAAASAVQAPRAPFYLAIVASSGSLSVGRINPGSGAATAGAGKRTLAVAADGGNFPLPATLTGATADLLCPWIYAGKDPD